MTKVSIHAPARGATRLVSSTATWRCFNPRTREGCDIRCGIDPKQLNCFNPRTREGCDLERTSLIQRIGVSIHAPARGATAFAFQIQKEYCFNPRTREGCDKRENQRGAI